MKTIRIFSFLIIIIFVISCQDNKKRERIINKTVEVAHKDTLGGIWNLYKVNDTLFDINKMYGFEADKPTLKIEVYKNHISGFSGCNSYGGNVKIDSTKITLIDGILATEIGCGGNIWENDYFSRLGDIQSYKFGTDTLKIFNSNSKSMTFLRRHLHPLEFNSWELSKVNDTIFDIKKVYNSPNEAQPILVFNFEKNQIGGWDGCNRFGLTIDFKEDHYTSGELISDSRGCYPDWLEKFYSILKDNKSIEIKKNTLLLTNSKRNTLEFKKVE